MKRHSSTLDDIDGTAAEWVARRDAGLAEHEQIEFEAWCAASVLHAEAVARFEMTWIALGRPRRAGAQTELTRELQRTARRRRQRRLVRAGAGLAVVLAVGLAWRELRPPIVPRSQTVMHVPTRLNLADGSVIEYPPTAEVKVDYSGTLRRVTLSRGEAHFTVAPDPARPFVVDAGGVAVRAVGTAFSVQLGGRAVEVLVTEGVVAVAKAAPKGAAAASADPPVPLAVVGAGNRLVIAVALQPTAVPQLNPVEHQEVAERLAWLNPRVEFSGAPLSEVVAVLNRYNRERLVLGDGALADVPLSGLFRADDAETFIRMLETGFGISIERRDGEIVLRKAR